MQIWQLWNDIFNLLNARYGVKGPGEADLSSLRSKIKNFHTVFVEVFEPSDVTPYIHLIIAHSVDHLVRFKALWRFSQEGFEAGNKQHRHFYGRCTQRGGRCGGSNQYTVKIKDDEKQKPKGRRTSSLQQILYKHWRVLFGRFESWRKDLSQEDEEEDLTFEEMDEVDEMAEEDGDRYEDSYSNSDNDRSNDSDTDVDSEADVNDLLEKMGRR